MASLARLAFAATAAIVLAACASAPKSAGGTQNAVPMTSAPIATAIDPAQAPFIASRKSKKFYPAACSTVKLIKTVDQVGFASMKDALAAGFAKDLYSTDCAY